MGKGGLCCDGTCNKNEQNQSDSNRMYCDDKDDDMKGPVDTSNWIVKDKIMTGEYPGNKEDHLHISNLSCLLDNGIRVFVCLQEESELKNFRPYKDDVLKIAVEKGIDPNTIEFMHFPMEDGGVAESVEVLADFIETLLSKLNDAAGDDNNNDNDNDRGDNNVDDDKKRSRKIYLHCWAGRGRTGIIAACLLGRLYKVSGLDALRRTQACYEQRIVGFGESPEYHPQKMQVIQYLRLIRQRDGDLNVSGGLNMSGGLGSSSENK
ncbi:hypothetical protein CYY_005416 [Polysphondylium violaceum]|uniref:Tyrosine specific protein phosphatases domain-containing protein n=1 Tax=Polysphondylium violaceum TaxID=133409 RepID=A0A8J4PWI4_9MYCE|nr:hypothetical protein CYY_005416 [Polysphondylium violaceum]